MGSNTGVSVPDLASVNGAANTDQVLIVSDAASNTPLVRLIDTIDFFGNTSGVRINLGSSSTPANSTPTIKQGTIFFDSSYLYVATANNTLKRVALGSF